MAPGFDLFHAQVQARPNEAMSILAVDNPLKAATTPTTADVVSSQRPVRSFRARDLAGLVV
jgi:hypothetical protein